MDGSCALKHAVVTGTSTGIGRATALRLAADGYHVFATVRRTHDGEAVVRDDPARRITPVIMDLTDHGSIVAAMREVGAHVGAAGVDVLVNNAGTGVFEPLELISADTFRRSLDINVTGPLLMSQAFLPLLRGARGRIVMIGSIGDRITIPFAGPIAAAKRALLALTEALRLEVAPWGVKVVLIEPASIHTEAVDKLEADTAETLERFGPDGRFLYGDAFRNVTRRGLAQERGGSSPDVVAAAVARAVSTPRPRARYLVGKDSRRLALIAKLPAPVLDRLRRRLFGLPKPGSVRPRPLRSPVI